MASYTKIPAKNKQGYKYDCRIQGSPDPITGERKQISRRGDTKKEALDRAEKALVSMEGLSLNDKDLQKIKFGKLAAEWLEIYSLTNVKKSTIRVRSKEIKILNRYLESTPITKISHRGYQKILQDLHKEDYARTTIEGVHVTANMIFKYAIKERIRKDNPCADIIIPAKKLTVEDIEQSLIEESYLEQQELVEFLNVVTEYGLDLDKERFYLLAFSGMRVGEVCALKWSDINFESNQVKITKTLYNPDNNQFKYELTPPKTKAAIRVIDMDDSVMNLLALLKTRFTHLPQAKLEQSFVFQRENNTPFIPKTINTRMQRLLDKTSISKKATPHIFRHTHVSTLTEAGIDLATIMERVGHDDMETTMKIYTHVTNKMRATAKEKIKNYFSTLLNS